MFATSYESLVTDGPLVRHEADEEGFVFRIGFVWTNTLNNGTTQGVGIDSDCGGWTSNDSRDSGNVGVGRILDEWTVSDDEQCNAGASVYCFAQ